MRNATSFNFLFLQVENLKLSGNVSLSELLATISEVQEITNPEEEKFYAGDIYVAIDFIYVFIQIANTSVQNMTRDNNTEFSKVNTN